MKAFVQEQRAFNQTSDPRETMMMIISKRSVDLKRRNDGLCSRMWRVGVYLRIWWTVACMCLREKRDSEDEKWKVKWKSKIVSVYL